MRTEVLRRSIMAVKERAAKQELVRTTDPTKQYGRVQSKVRANLKSQEKVKRAKKAENAYANASSNKLESYSNTESSRNKVNKGPAFFTKVQNLTITPMKSNKNKLTKL